MHRTTFSLLTPVTKLRRAALEPARGCVASVGARDALPTVPSVRRVMAAARSRLASEAHDSTVVRTARAHQGDERADIGHFDSPVAAFLLASPFQGISDDSVSARSSICGARPR